MRKTFRRIQIKPSGGYSSFLHIVLTAVLPIIAYVLVRLEFAVIALVVVIISKWRMFAVKLRHWPQNIRANAVDILTAFSLIIFMSLSTTQLHQIIWVVMYALWLLFIKPRSTPLWVGLQAMIAQSLALVTIFLIWNESSETLLTVGAWAITYLCARHFLSAFDESMARVSAHVWAFFAASLTWLTSHWLLYYKVISQPALMITVIGYSVGALYYLQHTDRLSKGVRRQFVILMVTIVMFILVFSDWSGDII